MKIRTKLILAIFGAAFFSFLITIIYGSFEMREAAVKNTKNLLQTVANIQKSRIENIIEINLERINSFNNRVGVIDALSAFDQNQSEETREALKIRLEEVKKLSPDYKELMILNPDGIVITSINGINRPKEGENLSQDPIFIAGKEKANIIFSHDIISHTDNFYLSGPIMQNGQLLGVTIIKTSGQKITEILNDYSGLGKTGETLLGKKNNEGNIEYVTKTRFPISDVTISATDTNRPIVQAVNKNEQLFTNLIDYRGQKVYSVTKYIPATDWGLVIKIDASEIFDPINQNIILLLIISLIYLVIAFVVSWFIAKTIYDPIEKLHNGVEKVKHGDLNIKVATNNPDEIGQLSRSFDSMLVSIKQSRQEIDSKVSQQTQAIQNYNKRLENQQKAILNILEDVEEERNKTKNEKDKIETILKGIGDGVFVVNQQQKIIVFNTAAEKLSGYPAAEVIGQDYKKILKFVIEKTGHINDAFIKNALKLGKEQTMANHTVLIRKDGQKIPVADSSAPLFDKQGNIIGCVVVLRDVTKEREVEKMKSEFVSVASHQLRTPLTSIKWLLEMILEGDVGKITAKQKKHLQDIFASNERMITLVNDLLNVSRIESGKIKIIPKEVQIENVFETAIKELQQMAKERKVTLICNKPKPPLPKLFIDPERIGEAFKNLVSNAIKYNKQGGKVDLFCKRTDHKITFAVKDTGVGIPKDQQKCIFQKFFRSDNVIKLQTEGTGLGLYITKSIIESSGGKIWFESEEGKGTTFYFTLPIKK